MVFNQSNPYIHVYTVLPYCATCMSTCISIHRDVSPSHGFVLLNRLSSDNLQEMVGAGSEYRVQGVFVLFKKHSGTKSCTYMYGTKYWVYHIVHCIYA